MGILLYTCRTIIWVEFAKPCNCTCHRRIANLRGGMGGVEISGSDSVFCKSTGHWMMAVDGWPWDLDGLGCCGSPVKCSRVGRRVRSLGLGRDGTIGWGMVGGVERNSLLSVPHLLRRSTLALARLRFPRPAAPLHQNSSSPLRRGGGRGRRAFFTCSNGWL